MNILKLIFLIIFISEFKLNFSYKILGIFPTFLRSHYHVGRGLMKGLAAVGHEVTIVSPFKEQNPPKNYTQLHLTEIWKADCK